MCQAQLPKSKKTGIVKLVVSTFKNVCKKNYACANTNMCLIKIESNVYFVAFFEALKSFLFVTVNKQTVKGKKVFL